MLITRNSNDHVKAARLVRDGKDKSLLFVEGERLVADCLSSRLPIPTAFHLPNPSDQIAPLINALQNQGTLLLSTTPEVLASLSDTVTPQGIIALAERPQTIPATFWSTLPASPLLVALDRIQDPGNLGTLLRTAEAAGAHGLITLSGTAEPFSPKALRASMGSAFRLPILANITSTDLLASAQLHNLQTFAAGEGDLRSGCASAHAASATHAGATAIDGAASVFTVLASLARVLTTGLATRANVARRHARIDHRVADRNDSGAGPADAGTRVHHLLGRRQVVRHAPGATNGCHRRRYGAH
jgi:TrmH family RNA methyltransferase